MCQITAVLDRDGGEESLMENVTEIEVGQEEIRLATMFDEPMVLRNVRIRRIDFLAGKVYLEDLNNG